MKKHPINDRDIEDKLINWFSDARRVVIAGVGSSLRKDDYVGAEIVRNMKGKVSSSVYLVECKTIPEDFLEPIVQFKPTHVLIIDATMLDREPRSSELVEPAKIVGHAISTHASPSTYSANIFPR